jgi:PAS domain S-box-containing protein
VHWSPECYQIVGLPDFDGNFASFGKLLHPEDETHALSTVARVLADGGEYRDEFRIIRSDGAVRWLSNRGKVCYDEQGKAERLIGTVQDVSARKEVERELRESEEHHRSILKTAMDGIVLLDATGRILEVNESYLAMSGYSQQELLNMSMADLEALESPEEVADHIGRVLKRHNDRFESRHRRKDGSCFEVEISVQCLDAKQSLLVVFVHDISVRKRHEEERKGLEAQLHQAQKLESVGRLAGGVAHDFNNMLSVIIGHAGMALMTQGLPLQLKTNLTEIEKAAERSADLTRQLLAFARRQTIEPRLLDLNQAVAGMLKMLQRLIGENVHLSWKPASSLWRVKLDPSQVDQILANLCVNARDSIAAVGNLTIETANCAADHEYCERHPVLVPGQYVRLSVTDDGCGIEAAELEHIFEPFYTTKEVGKGTGLGLATVYGIVKQNSGFIEVDSAAGRGSTFTIYLPRHDQQHLEPLSPEAAAELPRGQATILLVEDEPAILQVTSALLSSLGYRVLTANAPKEALQQAELHPEIDLLLSDVVMPEMDGLDLARRLKATHPRVRALFMSGYTSDIIGQHGILSKGLSFIHKPFSLPALASKVTEVLAGAR